MEKNINQNSKSELDAKLKWNLREISKLDPTRNFESEVSEILSLQIEDKRKQLEQLRQELKELKSDLLIPIAPNEFLSLQELNDKLTWNIKKYGQLNSEYNYEEELKSMQRMRPYRKASRLIELRRLRESQYTPPPRQIPTI